jgi:hypothetical protein
MLPVRVTESNMKDDPAIAAAFTDKVKRGIFEPAARRIPDDGREDRLAEAVAMTFEMFARYARRGGTIELHPGGRALLHRMRHLRVHDKLSLGAIGKAVVDEGLWFAAGQRRKSVNAGHVQRILTVAFYVGTFTWRGKQNVGRHEQVVLNARMNGGSVRFDLKKPFDTLAEMRGKEDWRTRRDSNSRPSGSKPDALSS